MTFFSHGTMAGVITYSLTNNMPVSIISGVLGSVPDLGKPFIPGWYGFFHRPWLNKGIKRILGFMSWVIPPIGFHWLIDFLCHDWESWNPQEWMTLFELAFWMYVFSMWFGVLGTMISFVGVIFGHLIYHKFLKGWV